MGEAEIRSWIEILANSDGEKLSAADKLHIVSAINVEVATSIMELNGEDGKKIGIEIAALQKSVKGLLDAARGVVPGINNGSHEQLTPSELAYKIVCDLRKKAVEQQKEFKKRVEVIHMILVDLFSVISPRMSKVKKRALIPLANEFGEKEGIRIKDVAQKISDNGHVQLEFGLSKAEILRLFQDEANEGHLSKLRTALKAEEGPSKEFKNLLGQRIIHRTAKLKVTHAEAMVLGEKANSMVNILLKGAPDFRFDEEVKSTHDPEKLNKMLTVVPVNPDKLRKVQSANVKLAIMRGQHLIETQADTEYEKAVLQELRRVLKRLVHKTEDGRLILNPPKDENYEVLDNPEALAGNDKWMYIGRVNIPGVVKEEIARIRKIILSDREDALSIFDGVRWKLSLTKDSTPKDIKNLPTNDDGLTSFDLELVKVLGILISFYGSRPSPNSLRYTALTGGSNSRSGGNHFSIHGVWSFLHRSRANEYDETTGEPKTQADPVETQVDAFLPEIAEKEDHEIYEANRDLATAEKLAVTLSFDEFTVDLMESVQSRHDFKYRSLHAEPELSADISRTFADFHERNSGIGDVEMIPEDVNIQKLLESRRVPIDKNYEGQVLLFLDILTRTKPGSKELENYSTLLYIMTYHKAQLRNVLNICSRWSANRGMSKYCHVIEQKAKILEGIVTNRLREVPETKLTITSGKKMNKATTTTDFGERQVRRAVDYMGPLAIEQESCKKKKSKTYMAKFNRRRNREMPAYMIKENDDGTFECHLVSSKFQLLIIWRLVPSNRQGFYIPHRIVHKQERGEDGKYSLVEDHAIQMEPVFFRTIARTILEQIDPTVGMNDCNKKLFKAIARKVQK